MYQYHLLGLYVLHCVGLSVLVSSMRPVYFILYPVCVLLSSMRPVVLYCMGLCLLELSMRPVCSILYSVCVFYILSSLYVAQ